MEGKQRLLQILAFTTGPAIDVVQHYFEFKIIRPGTDFEDYLNDLQNKHKIFHEHYPKIPCCECLRTSIAAPLKRGCLGYQQFSKLYDENGTVTAGHEKKIGRRISQLCICKVSAQKSIKVTDIDLTLLNAIIQHCCHYTITQKIDKWMKVIKEVRDTISHWSEGQLEKNMFDQTWKKLEKATLQCAGDIGHTSVKIFQMTIDSITTCSVDDLKKRILQTTDKLSEVHKDRKGIITTVESILSKQNEVCDQLCSNSKDFKEVKSVVSGVNNVIDEKSYTLEGQEKDGKLQRCVVKAPTNKPDQQIALILGIRTRDVMKQVQDFPQVQTEIRNLKHMGKSIEVKIDTTFQRQAENQGEYTKGKKKRKKTIGEDSFSTAWDEESTIRYLEDNRQAITKCADNNDLDENEALTTVLTNDLIMEEPDNDDKLQTEQKPGLLVNALITEPDQQTAFASARSWFYKLVICCDGMVVNIDLCDHMLNRNVRCIYDAVQKGQKVVDKSRHLHSLFNHQDKDFEILLNLSILLTNRFIEPEDWILSVIEKKNMMACYMLLSCMAGNDARTKYVIIQALERSFDTKDKNILNIISCFITREFVRSGQCDINSILDIWPAIVCYNKECGKSVFCSKELVIVVETVQTFESLPLKFWNIRIKYLPEMDLVPNEEKVRKKNCSNTNLRKSLKDNFPSNFEIDGNHASELFKMHSKLTFISKSVYKQEGNAKIEFPCIQLFCRVKGLIPVKEKHFPKTIKNVRTDILEGASVLSAKLRVGDQINSKHSIGTLGGFVKILGEITFLTCAHMVLHKDDLSSIKLRIPTNEAIYIKCEQTSAVSHESFLCGKLRHIEFKPDSPGETSIDAALIKIKKGIIVDNDDFLANKRANKHSMNLLGLVSPFLNENCLDTDKMFYGCSYRQFTNVSIGAVSRISVNVEEREEKEEGIDLESIVDTYEKIVQVEKSSTFSSTAPVFYTNAHLQEIRLKKVDKERTLRRRSRCMFNQLAATHIPFLPGDSGTCIYVCDNKIKKYGCIGMAIANHPGLDGGVVLTPMNEILKIFHVDIK